jgi:hypothetical protein
LIAPLTSVGSALLLFLLCQSVGWTWAQNCAPNWADRPRSAACLRLLAAFGVGLWILSITVMAWGMTVGLSVEKNLLLWIALVAGGWRSLPLVFRDYRLAWDGSFPKCAAVVMVAFTCAGLAFALVPPVFTDTVRYHLGVPHSWMHQGAIGKLPNFSEQHLVMMWQHASLLLLGFDQVAGAKVFCFLAYPLTLLAVALWVNARAGRAAALFSVVMLGATPTLFGNSVLGGVDAGLAFFSAMALLFFFSPTTIHHPRSAIHAWVGVMCGLAFCTKWQGLVLVPALAAVLMVVGPPGRLRAMLWIGLFCGLMFLPWGLRNFLWSGDPVYPFLARFFDADATAIAGRFDRLMAHYGLSGLPWWQYLLYPFHLVFADSQFWFGGTITFESGIGAMYLVMIPFCLVAIRKQTVLMQLLVFGAVCFVCGLGLGQLPRFWMPVWISIAIASGLAWALAGSDMRRTLACVLALSSVWNLWEVSVSLNQPGFAPLSYFRGADSDPVFSRAQAESRAARWVAARHPGAPILLVGLDGRLYWDNPVIVDGPFDEKTLARIARVSDSPEQIAAQLKARGIGLVAVDSGRAEKLDAQFGYMGWDREARQRVGEFLLKRVKVVHREGTIQIGTVE